MSTCQDEFLRDQCSTSKTWMPSTILIYGYSTHYSYCSVRVFIGNLNLMKFMALYVCFWHGLKWSLFPRACKGRFPAFDSLAWNEIILARRPLEMFVEQVSTPYLPVLHKKYYYSCSDGIWFKSLTWLSVKNSFIEKKTIVDRPIYKSDGSLVADALAVPFVFSVDGFQAVGMQFQCTYVSLDLFSCTHRPCCARIRMSFRAASVM